jgi:hypothetical protein
MEHLLDEGTTAQVHLHHTPRDMTQPLARKEFRDQCRDRDAGTCVVPQYTDTADDVHHIIERAEWRDGGYYKRNGASVCNAHHQLAEADYLPPQGFWRWLDLQPLTPDGMSEHVTKWGDELQVPSEKELTRDLIKSPSTGHLPDSPDHEHRRNDYSHQELQHFVCDMESDLPVVVTVKMDGSNAMITRPPEIMPDPSRHRPAHGVAARNGKHATHDAFDLLKKRNREQYGVKIPPHIQICGKWLFARHSIHYTDPEDCDDPECDDHAGAVRNYFQVFGVYDNRFDIWLSWPEVEEWAAKIGAETVPVVDKRVFEYPDHVYEIYPKADRLIQNGHEGIVIRSALPFHYGQFESRLGKYVRENHVTTDEHWRQQAIVQNVER